MMDFLNESFMKKEQIVVAPSKAFLDTLECLEKLPNEEEDQKPSSLGKRNRDTTAPEEPRKKRACLYDLAQKKCEQAIWSDKLLQTLFHKKIAKAIFNELNELNELNEQGVKP